jgi:PAS domain S-box-containing protein
MSTRGIRSKLLVLVATLFIFLAIGYGFFLTLLNKNTIEIESLRAYFNSSGISTRPDSIRSTSIQNVSSTIVTSKDITASADDIISSIRARDKKIFWGIVVSVIGVATILAIGSFLIIRAFMRSLNNPARVLTNLVQGDTSLHVAPTKDEFSVLTEAANKLSDNLKRSSTFAQSIGEGNFDFDFAPVSEKDTLGNSLVQMREKLKSIADADRKRNWTTAGVAKFADLIRRREDQQALADLLISELVKYLKANQGGLFILNRDDEKDPYLELTACYAYDRKKHFTKRVDIGNGLLGQCYMEGEPVHLTEIPKNYVAITSGLGSGNPTSLLIVPLKLNDAKEGVIELASFNKFERHEIDFVLEVGEIIASAIATARVAGHTKKMLEESQQQAEQMRAQEEEMRQNMEEMQATQEAMERQTTEIKKMQANLELEKSMFGVLMEFLPDRITFKDTESRIMRINKAKALRLNMAPEDVVGKTDYDFFNKEHAAKAMAEEKALIQSGKPLMDIEEQLVFNNGDVAWVSTSRIPFKNEHRQTTGMFIITRDVTKQKIAELSLHDRDNIIHSLLKDLPILHYKISKDKMIYDVWKGNKNSGLPDSTQLTSKALKDVFPKVYQSIQEGDLPKDPRVSDQYIHYLFKDSIHTGAYWVYAIANEKQ